MKKLLLIITNILIIPPVAMYSYYTFSPAKQAQDNPPTITTHSTPRVLGATDDQDQIYFTVNIPATFKQDISAPNIVYSVNGESGEINIDNSLKAGDGITIDGREITNTGILTLVAGDGVSVDGNTITNSGIISLSAGTGISIDGSTITNTYSFTPDYTQSGWTDNGSSVVLTTTSDTVTVGTLTTGAITASSLTVDGLSVLSGNATIGNGVAVLPSVDLGSDLGSSSLRFNNLWVANINSNSSQSFSGQTTFSYPPTDTTLDEASVLINPTTSAANGQLLGLAIAGYQKALIDEDGDIILGYSDATSAPASDYPLNIYGHSGTRVSFVDTAGNAYFAGAAQVGNGTSSLPSLTFASDTGTGFYRFAYGKIATTHAGSAAWVFGNTEMYGYNSGAPWLRRTSIATTTPAFSFYGDTNTGLTSGGADELVLSTGGLERLRVDSSGNVGIGTTSPSENLVLGTDIGDVGTGTVLSIGNNASPQIALGEDNNNLAKIVWDATNNDLLLYSKVSGTWKTNTLVLDSGNVGIGTASPGAKLHVGSSTNEVVQMILGTTSGGYDNGGLLTFSGAGGNPIAGIKGTFNSSSEGQIEFQTYGLGTQMILKAGNVGIGTTSPGAKLHINGGVGSLSTGLAFGDGDTGIHEHVDDIIIISTDGSKNLYIGNGIVGATNATGSVYSALLNEIPSSTNPSVIPSYQSGNTNTGLGLAGNEILSLIAGGTNGLNVISSGNVGIGTTSPQSKLSVAGAASLGSTYAGISAPTNGLIVEGNVGIGTTSPGYPLDVNGSIRSNGLTFLTGHSISHYLYNMGTSSGLSEIRSSGDLYLNPTDNVGIGTSSPETKLDIVGGDILIDEDRKMIFGNANVYLTGSSTTGTIGLATAATSRLEIDNSGNVTLTSLGTGTIYSNSGVLTNTDPSDETLKNNILTLEDGTLNKLLGLRPVSFDWKSTGDGALGFIAQEVNQVFPELVGSNSDGTLGLYTTQFIPVLAKAIQEQQLEIDGLSSATGSAQLVEIEESVGILEGLIAEIRDWIEELQGKWTALADSLTTKKVNTEELCVGETEDKTCLTQDQVDKLIELLPSPTPEPSSTPEPSTSPAPSTDPSPTPDPTPEASDSGSVTP